MISEADAATWQAEVQEATGMPMTSTTSVCVCLSLSLPLSRSLPLSLSLALSLSLPHSLQSKSMQTMKPWRLLSHFVPNNLGVSHCCVEAASKWGDKYISVEHLVFAFCKA
jgi:hypothetical protein